MELCEGVYLQEEFFEKKETGAYSVVEGLHCLSSFDGKYRFYLTAFDISFHVGLCHALILLTSLGCAMLYYRLMVETSVICFVCHLCISGIYIPRLHQQWILCDREHHGR